MEAKNPLDKRAAVRKSIRGFSDNKRHVSLNKNHPAIDTGWFIII
jgi:hypothetical protein